MEWPFNGKVVLHEKGDYHALKRPLWGWGVSAKFHCLYVPPSLVVCTRGGQLARWTSHIIGRRELPLRVAGSIAVWWKPDQRPLLITLQPISDRQPPAPGTKHHWIHICRWTLWTVWSFTTSVIPEGSSGNGLPASCHFHAMPDMLNENHVSGSPTPDFTSQWWNKSHLVHLTFVAGD